MGCGMASHGIFSIADIELSLRPGFGWRDLCAYLQNNGTCGSGFTCVTSQGRHTTPPLVLGRGLTVLTPLIDPEMGADTDITDTGASTASSSSNVGAVAGAVAGILIVISIFLTAIVVVSVILLDLQFPLMDISVAGCSTIVFAHAISKIQLHFPNRGSTQFLTCSFLTAGC